jgi:YgiT-type zinc finger domain-containing protein
MAGKPRRKAKAATCVICGVGQVRPGITTVSFTEGTTTVVVKDVPADTCDECGENYFDAPVAQWIYEQIDGAVKRGAEVEILRYAA